ncbi:MAG: type II toxin-antitoxin system RelE/ParE family toxin [Deltaproteobacteria bacterium]
MDIFFKHTKLAKVFNDGARLHKEYGPKNAQLIKNRMAVLSAAACLADVPVSPPERRHLLTGDLPGCYAVDLQHPFRLVFAPVADPVPTRRDGGHDLQKITSIIILQVVDYH